MIKILLIDCSRSLEPELRDVYDVHHPPVGLLALATHINKSDMGKYTNIKLIDSTIDFKTYEELDRIIVDTAPDIVGLRCLHKYTDQFHYASSVAKQLPNKPLVIGGGPYPSAAPQETMEKDEYLDIVVVGEGETVFYDLISAYHNKKNHSLMCLEYIIDRTEKLNNQKPGTQYRIWIVFLFRIGQKLILIVTKI